MKVRNTISLCTFILFFVTSVFGVRVSADEGMPDNGIPVVYIDVDESEVLISVSERNDGPEPEEEKEAGYAEEKEKAVLPIRVPETGIE